MRGALRLFEKHRSNFFLSLPGHAPKQCFRNRNTYPKCVLSIAFPLIRISVLLCIVVFHERESKLTGEHVDGWIGRSHELGLTKELLRLVVTAGLHGRNKIEGHAIQFPLQYSLILRILF